MNVTREPPGLQVVGDGDICAPDVKLPLAEPQHPAQHAAGVDTWHGDDVNIPTLKYQTCCDI